jgi:HPt (histidine-containing phosphotransfer) domain-containing protein
VTTGSRANATDRVYSIFASDPDYRELLEMFVEGMPAKQVELEACFRAETLEPLALKAHQIKGAGGGYGFPGLTDRAAALEAACQAHDRSAVASTLNALIEYMNLLTV